MRADQTVGGPEWCTVYKREAAEARRPPHRHTTHRKRPDRSAGRTLFGPLLIPVFAVIGVHWRGESGSDLKK